jgi:hypothetical protein
VINNLFFVWEEVCISCIVLFFNIEKKLRACKREDGNELMMRVSLYHLRLQFSIDNSAEDEIILYCEGVRRKGSSPC